MKYRLVLNFVFILILTYSINGQPDSSIVDTTHTFQRVLVEGTDTLYIADLDSIDITAARLFESDEDYKLFLRYKRSAVVVFPFAKEAVDTYRKILEETADLKRGKKRKYVRELNKEYKSDYKDKFKNMTRTQGKVMIKMIEKELDISFFELIKEVKGGFTAAYWDGLSKLYGYHLKEKYQRGDDSLLDSVLDDYAGKLKAQNPVISN
ncbi:MAG: DUF4294 domain-containing protein [Saprospiraceae bacterium]